jgi:hypothetical protein
MKLREIVKLTGNELCRCEPSWGGTWGYGNGSGKICGFKTEEKAIQAILEDKFGGPLGELCLKLLKKHKPKESKQDE